MALDALGLVQSVRVDTAWLPPIVVDQSGVPAAGGDAWVARLLRPKVTAQLVTGPVYWAPEGEPGPTRWGLVLAAGAGVLLFALYGAAALLRGK